MTAEFRETPELFKVNGRPLNSVGRVDRGQAIEPIHPLHIDRPIKPTAEEKALAVGDITLGLDYLDYVYSQPEDHSNTIASHVLRFE